FVSGQPAAIFHADIDTVVLGRVAESVHRVTARLNNFYLFLEHIAEHDQTAVRFAQSFLGSIENLSLCDPTEKVLAQNKIWQILERHFVGGHGILFRHVDVRAWKENLVPQMPGVGVIHWNTNLKLRISGLADSHVIGENHRVSGSPSLIIFRLSDDQATFLNSERNMIKGNLFVRTTNALKGFDFSRISNSTPLNSIQPKKPMRITGMNGVDSIFLALQPVAGQQRRADLPEDTIEHK